MKGLMIRLTDDERAELERRRAAGGHRSLNEAVKAWLRVPNPQLHRLNEQTAQSFNPAVGTMFEPPGPAPELHVTKSKEPARAGFKATIPGSRVVKQSFSSGADKPVTRLKGSWKAP